MPKVLYGVNLKQAQRLQLAGSTKILKLGCGTGVLAFDAAGGFLLLHSAPKFPDSPADAQYGGIYAPELRHAQSFACASLAPAAVDEAAAMLQTTNLYIYSPLQLPEPVAKSFPNVSLLLSQALPYEGAQLNPANDRRVADLKTSGIYMADACWMHEMSMHGHTGRLLLPQSSRVAMLWQLLELMT